MKSMLMKSKSIDDLCFSCVGLTNLHLDSEVDWAMRKVVSIRTEGFMHLESYTKGP